MSSSCRARHSSLRAERVARVALRVVGKVSIVWVDIGCDNVVYRVGDIRVCVLSKSVLSLDKRLSLYREGVISEGVHRGYALFHLISPCNCNKRARDASNAAEGAGACSLRALGEG